MDLQTIKIKLSNSKLFKDSFWAVFGNGLGNGLMLIAGILIARFLGKDMYGEYGMVKSTMFYIASFATFGLGLTSTKYISSYSESHPERQKSIIVDSLRITLTFSGIIAILLFILAPQVARYMESDSYILPLRALSVVIIFKAITTTQVGILAGFKDFKHIAYNSLLSGIFLIASCIPLTIYWQLKGALAALLVSQIFNSIINYLYVNKHIKALKNQENLSITKELLKFSFPVALQESSYTICNWAAIMLLTKYSTIGELGLYTASAQWNAIITMVPALLSNVVLSYLSGYHANNRQHNKTMKMMLTINIFCTLIPFIIVYCLARFIASFYGPTFIDMPSVLRICTACTILESASTVLRSDILAKGKPWILFALRGVRDIILVVIVYYLLITHNGENGAILFAWSNLSVSVIFFTSLVITYLFLLHAEKKTQICN